MAVSIRRSRAIGALSVTPLIDVVFLLLIFFLVTSKFAEKERELDLNLPSVTEALPATATPDEIVINIDKDGRYFIGGAFRQLEQVKEILKRAQTNNPLTQAVVIRTDKDTKSQHLLKIFGICKDVEIHNYAVATSDE